MTDKTTNAEMKACRAELQRAIDHVHVVITSSHLPGWKDNRAAWETIRNTLNTRAVEDAEAVAFLKRWKDPDSGEGRIRVDLRIDCEPWLTAARPTITPLYTHPPRATSAEDARDAARWRQFVEMIDPDKVPGGFTVYFAVEKGTDQLCYFDCVTELVDAAMAQRGDKKDDDAM